MPYGFSFEEIKKIFKPKPQKKEWGRYIEIANRPEYGLEQLFIKKGKAQPLQHHVKKGGTVFLQEGQVILRLVKKNGEKTALKMNHGNVFEIPCGVSYAFAAITDSTSYFFSNGFEHEDKYILETEKEAQNSFKHSLELAKKNSPKPVRTIDFRDKYWGSIETIVSKDYCGKKIVMKKGTQNSLEVHCNKHETYFVHEGKVKIGLRVGRAQNRSIMLEKGEVFNIPPGLMHMKIAPVDCIIMEISTKDEDSDSHIVEDGMKYAHM